MDKTISTYRSAQKLETFWIVFGILSLLTIHALFFCSNLPQEFYSIIDAVFIANLLFLFGAITLVLAFIARMSIPLIKPLHWYAITCYLFYTRINKNNISAIFRYSKMNILRKKNEYLVARAILVLVFYAVLYIGFEKMIVMIAIALFVLTTGMVLYIPAQQLRIPTLNITLLIEHLITFFKNDSTTTKGAIFSIYFIAGLISAFSGDARFDYVLNNNRVSIENPRFNGELVYIGTTQNGAIFYEENNYYRYFSHDGNVSIKATIPQEIIWYKVPLFFPNSWYDYFRDIRGQLFPDVSTSQLNKCDSNLYYQCSTVAD